MSAREPYVPDPDWATWNPSAPQGCPPETWARVVASAAHHMANPQAPRRPCATAEEALWQGRADGMAAGDRVPPHLIDRMVALHRPYLAPPGGQADAGTEAA